MNTELARKWVAALRSGKYEQGRGRLYSKIDDTYCCLGVLCKVAEIPHGTGPYERAFMFDVQGNLESFSYTPCREWWNHNFGYSTDIGYDKYFTLNDNVGMSFAEIADVIEKDFGL